MNDYKELVVQCEEWIAKADNFGADDLANYISRCADAIEQLVKDRNVLQLQNHLERCEHEHTRKERDAAVADLKGLHDALEGRGLCCYACKNDVFDYDKSVCAGCALHDNWEWRGVREDDDEIY